MSGQLSKSETELVDTRLTSAGIEASLFRLESQGLICVQHNPCPIVSVVTFAFSIVIHIFFYFVAHNYTCGCRRAKKEIRLLRASEAALLEERLRTSDEVPPS